MLKIKKPCCGSCNHGKKCEDKDTIQKPRPKINKKKLVEKHKSDPMYQMFGEKYIQIKNNI